MAFAICQRSADRGRGADAGAALFPAARNKGIASNVKDPFVPMVHNGQAWFLR